MTILDDIQSIRQDTILTFSSVTTELRNELYNRTPIDTHELQESWTFETNELQWFASTNVRHNFVIWRGRKQINGRWYGSLQGWGLLGGHELLRKYDGRLNDKFNNL
jgi:hypothetical protein